MFVFYGDPNMIENSAGSSVASGGVSAAPGKKVVQDVVIRFAGNSQDGIQSIGGFLARLGGRTEKDVMTYMTIPATISGGPSIFQVRLGTGEVLSAGDDVDILVTFYQHSFNDHIDSLRDGGVLLYDSDNVLPDPNQKRYRAVGIPITSMTVEAIGGTAKDKGKNMFVLGLVARMFDLDVPKLEAMLQGYYKGKNEDIIRSVLGAFHAGYGYDVGKVRTHSNSRHRSPSPIRKKSSPTATKRLPTQHWRRVCDSAPAIQSRRGRASWKSCVVELPKYGGIFVQTEDELAAIAMACGGSYAGYVSLTGTSGPASRSSPRPSAGRSWRRCRLLLLMCHAVGPSTGLPTNVEQSDPEHLRVRQPRRCAAHRARASLR